MDLFENRNSNSVSGVTDSPCGSHPAAQAETRNTEKHEVRERGGEERERGGGESDES